MTTITFYRQEAQRHRELAAAEPSPRLAQQLLAFARDYDALVDILENSEGIDAPPPAGPEQQQQQQQQQLQQQKEEDDK